MWGNSKTEEKQSISQGMRKFSQPHKRFAKILQHHKCLAKISQGLPTIHKPVLLCEIHANFSLRIPTASMQKANGQWEANSQQESQKVF